MSKLVLLQDFIPALHQCLGMSEGAEFSSEDISLLFCKVFHVPSSRSDADAAMKKVAGGHKSWSCTSANVLDVLLEMERAKEKNEMLYWDCQLLNSGNLHQLLQKLPQRNDSEVLRNAFNSVSGLPQPQTAEIDIFQREKVLEKKQLCQTATSLKRLQKAVKQCWARLASEGVSSLLPSPLCNQRLGLKGQTWGSVSLSDVILLVEVKYDVVTHLLYTEMLQEHYTQSVWEMLLPWQQRKEVEALETMAEEVLQSADMLGLVFLPGAFRIYKTRCSELREESCSAVALLNQLQTFCQGEQNQLTLLGQRLCDKSLRLLCLHVLLAIYRAQREKQSHSALLASHQSWESWPQVLSPCRAEYVTLLLQNDDKGEEGKEDFETTDQRTELQLLVLTQEKERKHLLTLLHRISLEDLQEAGCAIPPKDNGGFDADQISLRAGCIKRLKQIHAQLQTQNGSENNSKQASIQMDMQGKWSQSLVEDCNLLLLMQLMKVQESETLALLQVLLHRDSQAAQALREKYKAELQTQRFPNLLHLLMSDDPLIPGSMLAEHINNELVTPESSCTGEVENIYAESVPTTTTDLTNEPSRERLEVPTAGGSAKQEVCSGCGAIMEELPYLEILCVPDAQANAPTPEAGAGREEDINTNLESFDKQGSLIPLAWSKPPEDDADRKAEEGDGEAEKYQDTLSSLGTQGQSTQCEEAVQKRDSKEVDTLAQYDAQFADQQLKKVENPIPDQPSEGEAATEIDPCSLAENLLEEQPHLSRDSFGCIAEGTSGDTVSTSREMTESERWDSRGSELSDNEEMIHSQESTIASSLSGRTTMLETDQLERDELMRDQVSAVERERTMRSLVDMQKKFEQKHQRDKERQMFRVRTVNRKTLKVPFRQKMCTNIVFQVQERLSIILNRKAEEDLLGLKRTDRLKHLTEDLPLEDKTQQKTVVKERLEQLRRERSYIMQSKRDRNTTGFKELLAPVALNETEDEAS
ncbi:uncharacterized protein LOC122835532 isoform X2 [Gambusia affinis]|uniref:uncharacterized protein LOC122835532 isoform X2 n=1 Tax=Gambusia affinis TaxID=33528 RepID=UPI001CDD14C4|nr:uncharacterized protein LOC122835532 isoform X2 [Gambusia affinis]